LGWFEKNKGDALIHIKFGLKFILKLTLLASLFVAWVAAKEQKPQGAVWVAQIRGSINPAGVSYLKTSIKSAHENKAKALIVELDTPGGLVASVRDMAQVVDESPIPVIVYVSPAGAAATSAGALFMLSSHVAAMAPGTNIGAAHPVGSKGEEIKGPMGDKVLNDTAAFARSLAELRGRPIELAEQVVAKSKSFTAEEAHRNKLIEIIAATRAELLKKLHMREVKLKSVSHVIMTEGAVIVEVDMTMGQRLLHYIANPNIAGILMTLAMLLIYLSRIDSNGTNHFKKQFFLLRLTQAIRPIFNEDHRQRFELCHDKCSTREIPFPRLKWV